MEVLLKKGLKVITHKDGSKDYEPFAIYKDGKTERTFSVKSLSGAIGLIYVLSLDKYGISRKSEKEAIFILNECVDEYNHQTQLAENRKIIKEEIKYI